MRHAMTLNLSPEAMKAWSQNLGHADVMTTFTSYGAVPVHRQGELIRTRKPELSNLLNGPDVTELVERLTKKRGIA